MKRGKFFVIDGMDGSGKGTQIDLLKKKLTGIPAVFTREPGGSPRAELIRPILIDKEKPPSTVLSDFLLFWAAREDLLHQVILPTLKEGVHVISDRFDSSTWAFQLHGENNLRLLPHFVYLRNLVMCEDVPDAYIFLDLPAEVAYERCRRDAARVQSRFDVKPLDFHERVRTGFQTFPPRNVISSPVFLVDADRTPEKIHEVIWNIVSNILTEELVH